ncbi:MAG: hypothetical protein V2B20_20490 [Pseudomonadota bacterium]
MTKHFFFDTLQVPKNDYFAGFSEIFLEDCRKYPFNQVDAQPKFDLQRQNLPTITVGEDGMQFCKDCGGVLNLFGKDDRELCPACIQNLKKVTPSPPARHEETEDNFFSNTELFCENGKAVLRSKEGWELWSGQQGVRTDLKTVIAQARRIYTIRMRRQKN